MIPKSAGCGKGMAVNMDIVRIGVIGIGNMGSAHAVQIYEGRVNGAVLTAVCDVREERLQWARKRFNGSVSTFQEDWRMMESGKVDAVLIATPHKLHPVIAGKAFGCGLCVLTEKPAGIDAASVRSMNRTAEECGKVFGIMFNQRTNPLYGKLHDLIREGALGEIKRFVWIINNWYRTQAYYDSGDWRATWSGEGGGVLINQCPHNLDIWQWIMGMPVRLRAFCGIGHYHRIQVEDDATIYAEYANGATAVFITSTGEYPGTNRLEVSGTRGKAVVEEGRLKLQLLNRDERKICFLEKKGMPEEELTCATIEQKEPDSGHLKILQNFTDAVLYGKELIAPGREGIYSLMLSNAAYLSAWKDCWISIPADEHEFLDFLEKKQKEESKIPKAASEEKMTEGYSNRWNVRW